MIAQLRGTLLEASEGTCVLDVGGVGFELGISASTLFQLTSAPSEEVRLFCRMRTRDDVPVLYGFATAEERALFDLLVAVSGVGPKNALAILSTFSTEELVRIVAEGDARRLATAKGIGKKTANRLVLELEGPIKTNERLKGLALLAGAVPGTAEVAPEAAAALAEAREALVGMGFSDLEADRALEGAEPDATLQDLVGRALRRIGGGA